MLIQFCNTRTFCQRKTSVFSTTSLFFPRIIFFVNCSVFFQDQRKKGGSDFELNTVSSFHNTVALYWRAKIYTALSFACFNFFNIAHLHFIFSMENNVMCYCFCELVKTFIF